MEFSQSATISANQLPWSANPTTGALDPNWQGWKYDYYGPATSTPGALHHVYRLRDDGSTIGTIATCTYDTRGRVLTTTDTNSAVTDYAYDTAGNVNGHLRLTPLRP